MPHLNNITGVMNEVTTSRWIEERTREKRYPEREVKELSKALLNIRDMAEALAMAQQWGDLK